MFELSVEREFCAAHAILINGHREPTHGHNFRVTAVVRGAKLDKNDLVCDFHVIERELDRVVMPFNNANLNETSPFDRVNPTAERIAEHIAVSVMKSLPKGAALSRVSATEAPGCVATYLPHDEDGDGGAA